MTVERGDHVTIGKAKTVWRVDSVFERHGGVCVNVSRPLSSRRQVLGADVTVVGRHALRDPCAPPSTCTACGLPEPIALAP